MRSVFLTVFALSAWALATLPAGAAGSDIVKNGSGLTLGSGWYAHEVYQGAGFRWVKNDAEFIVNRPAGSLKKIWIDAEPGPGLGSGKMTLRVLEGSRAIASADYTGRQRLRFDLPVTAGSNATFKLHVDGGGRTVPRDRRILNFRVFALDDAASDQSLGAGHPDIAGPGIAIGDNWYSLEEFKGDTFRWVDNDARFSVTSPGRSTKRLKLIVAPGPGLSHPADFVITLRNGSGGAIQSAHVKGVKSTVYLTLPLNAGSNAFTLHVDGGGRRSTNGDTRTLDFRVFSLTVAD